MLEGRHIVVTGAGRGIGAALAASLAREGARVTCLDIDEQGARTSATLIREAGGAARACACDVTSMPDVERTLGVAVAAHGPVDALVANAGGAAGERTPFLELDAGRWRQMVDRNLTGAFNCGLAYGRHMAERDGGAIVFVTSIVADDVVLKDVVHYGAAKAGVRQLMRGMALELGAHGVRVNAVAPGYIVTPGNEQIVMRSHVANAVTARIPLGRLGRPDDICSAVSYLVGPGAAYTTGATILVDGGLALQQQDVSREEPT